MMASTGATARPDADGRRLGIDYETAQRASVRCCIVSYGFGFDVLARTIGVDDVSGLRELSNGRRPAGAVGPAHQREQGWATAGLQPTWSAPAEAGAV